MIDEYMVGKQGLKKFLTSPTEELLEQLGYLKVKMDEYKEEMSAVQEEILSRADAPKKAKVPYGTLTQGSRTEWSVTNIPKVYKIIGVKTFLEICSLPVGKLKKAIGELGITKLMDRGLVKKGDPTYYYSLKRADFVKNGKK